ALDVWCESVRYVRRDLRRAGLVVPEGFVLGGSESLVALPADRVALREELRLRERRRCGCASSALTATTAATRSNQPDVQRDRDRDDHDQPAQQRNRCARGRALETRPVQHLAPPMLGRTPTG